MRLEAEGMTIVWAASDGPSGGGDRVAAASHIQGQASDPGVSAWVGASAGSGKTKVLIDRMLRLLVAGAEPHRILALTFTNTAAAEMANRLQSKLAEWAVMARPKLAEVLEKDLLKRPAEREELERAQALFARVLDAPGGMKIQTIHSFCQSLLGRFPVESNTPPRFRLLDDRGRAELLNAELTDIILDAYQHPEAAMGQALTHLTESLQDTGFRDAMLGAAKKRARLQRLTQSGGLAALLAEMKSKLGVDLQSSREALIARAIGPEAIAETGFRGVWEVMRNAKGKHMAAAMQALTALFDDSLSLEEAWELAQSELLKKTDQEIRTHNFPTKGDLDAFPEVLEPLRAFQAGVKGCFDALLARDLYRANEAFLTVLAELLTRFERAKMARSLLDFDDLIERAGLLLEDSALWVHYKLDQGLDHILVDEAQDTNPAQWKVIQGLADLFFDSPPEAFERPRSLFVVGDEKQSIFSFQQADPRKFSQMRQYFKQRAGESGHDFRDLSLDVSFRSVPAILNSVNQVFDDPAAFRGVIDADATAWPQHQAARAGEPGKVIIWPAFEKEKAPKSAAKGVGEAAVAKEVGWKLPLKPVAEVRTDSALARTLAHQVYYWCYDPDGIDDPDCYLTIKSQKDDRHSRRRITPGDILVLVRKRNDFVAELNAQLKGLGVTQIAGRDRMKLSQQLAVHDLLSLARFLVLPSDDLNLAGLLKSPLVELSEAQLFELAAGRGKKSLWEALEGKASGAATGGAATGGAATGGAASEGDETGGATVDQAHRFLAACLARADAQPLYELFVWVLGHHQGRSRLLHRLGLDAEDAIDEFINLALDYDAQHPPSLQGFLKWMEGDEVEIKRDMEAGDGKLRIMTVHGSKGLQAPIVVLPLVETKKPKGDPWLFDENGMPLWLQNKDMAESYAKGLKDQQQQDEEEESRRLLYVALTRASDRLLICGADTKGKGWYNLVSQRMQAMVSPGQAPPAVEARLPEPPQVFEPLAAPDPSQMVDTAAPLSTARGTDQGAVLDEGQDSLPDWLVGPLPIEPQPPRPLKPSEQEAPRSFFRLGGDAQAAVERGIQVHRLLQYLPELSEDARQDAMARYLATQNRLSESEQARIAEDVARVLASAELAFAFEPGSRAEVPLSGQVGKDLITGRIDRLHIGEDRVVFVDYKTGAPPFDGRPPRAYSTQLRQYAAVLKQIYPGRTIEAFLVWTRSAEVMAVAV